MRAKHPRAVVLPPTLGEQAAYVKAAYGCIRESVLLLSRVTLDSEMARALRALNQIEDILWQECHDMERRILNGDLSDTDRA